MIAPFGVVQSLLSLEVAPEAALTVFTACTRVWILDELHDGFVRVSFSHFGDETVLPHDSLYFLVIHRRNPHFDTSPTVFPFADIKDVFDE